jgi:hypothetical protein
MIRSNRVAIVEWEKRETEKIKKGLRAGADGDRKLKQRAKKESFIEFKLSSCYNSTIK